MLRSSVATPTNWSARSDRRRRRRSTTSMVKVARNRATVSRTAELYPCDFRGAEACALERADLASAAILAAAHRRVAAPNVVLPAAVAAAPRTFDGVRRLLRGVAARRRRGRRQRLGLTGRRAAARRIVHGAVVEADRRHAL